MCNRDGKRDSFRKVIENLVATWLVEYNNTREYNIYYMRYSLKVTEDWFR